MHAVARERPVQDGNAVPAADLTADGAHPKARISGQDPVAAPPRPDDVEPVAMDAVRGAIMPHVPVLPETGRPLRAKARFRKDRDMTRSVPAEAVSDWKLEASNQRVESEVVREALRDWMRNRDSERRELETLRDAIKAGLDSGSDIPADEVFAELRAHYADKS